MAHEIEISRGALAIRPDQTSFDPDQIKALKLEEAPEGAVKVFLHYAQRIGLDPFAGQMYLVPYNGKWNIQVGIGGFRTIAERSGEYQGQTKVEWCGEDGQWVDVWLKKENPKAARVGVHRKGFKEPLYAVALWESYAPFFYNKDTKQFKLSPMWEKHGPGQLAKCVEALALRKAYPMDLLNVHTREEMESSEATESYVVEDKPQMVKSEPVEVLAYTDDQIDTASQMSDFIVEFMGEASLQNWYKSEQVIPFHDIPFGLNATTIKEMTRGHLAKLRNEVIK